MPNLEQVVRPSQTTDIRPGYLGTARALPAVPGVNEIVWGSAGNDVFAVQANIKAEVKVGEEEETERTFDTVRVKSKDDPDTFVDVEVMTEYQARNTISKNRTTLKFHPPEASENTEIVKRGTKR